MLIFPTDSSASLVCILRHFTYPNRVNPNWIVVLPTSLIPYVIYLQNKWHCSEGQRGIHFYHKESKGTSNVANKKTNYLLNCSIKKVAPTYEP